jgi:hypothetical protein
VGHVFAELGDQGLEVELLVDAQASQQQREPHPHPGDLLVDARVGVEAARAA